MIIYFLQRLFQALLTFVRGVAIKGEQPLFRVSPLIVFLMTLVGFAASIIIPQLVWSQHQPWLYPLLLFDFALGQAASWTLYMVEHHAIHGAIIRKAWVNAAVAEVASVIGLTIPPKRYQKSHNAKHHLPKVLATNGDPDYRWLKSLGFIPGQPISYYWRQLWLTLFNPLYYANFFLKRLRMNLIEAPLFHRLMVFFFWSAIAIVSYRYQLWVALFTYLVIIIFGYGISALLQTLTEHRWGYQGFDPAQKSFPRLLPIDKHPERFLLYLYWRAAILSTDLAQHQRHHAKPRNFDWPMVAYSQEAQDDLSSAVWGIKAHFNEAFTVLSEAKAQ